MDHPFPPDSSREVSIKITKEEIGRQLDAFVEKHGIKSLRDRLRIGLNEAAALGFEDTRKLVQELCGTLAVDESDAQMIYNNLVDMTLDMQQHGPWDYAEVLAQAESPEVKAWYMLNAAVSLGYESEHDLEEPELMEEIDRIKGHLKEGIADPEGFMQAAREHAIEKAEAAIYYSEDDRKAKDFDKSDPEHRYIPRGEGLGTFLPMALKGYEVGIVQDAEGWVYVGAQGMIGDRLIESCGLKRDVRPDPRDPKRKVTFYLNKDGQEVVKKVHRGLLVILSRSFDLAQAIAEAVRDHQSIMHLTEDAIKHKRVTQTSEGERDEAETPEEALEHWQRKQFLRRPDRAEGSAETTALSRPQDEFYDDMLYIRGMYVYLDAVKKAKQDRKKKGGKPLTSDDLEDISRKTWEKMAQKVDELRYVNELIDEMGDRLPQGIHSVIDMAGGAGDLGLAVGTKLMTQGREINDIEIVDPQEGTEDFMQNIIEHLPFRRDLEKVARHNNGYLQDAHIRPDSVVVAKHACGSLTDAIIKQFVESDSPMLIAMTCCQEKAQDDPASYGLGQEKWKNLCTCSGLTNTEVPEEPGKAHDIAAKKLHEGQQAMLGLDMARVDYLRRHGFKAELKINHKFPKGDVIIARRLPSNFMEKLAELQAMEKSDPVKFDNIVSRLSKLSKGGDYQGMRNSEFGEKWIDDDFNEMLDRLSPARVAKEKERVEKRRNQATEAYKRKLEQDIKAKKEAAEKERKKAQKELVKRIFGDCGGRQDLYLQNRAKSGKPPVPKNMLGDINRVITTIVQEAEGEDPERIRQAIDDKMEELGF